jgi:dipeptidyl aminopeptidase/acylaminoacyl peptidase
MAAVLVLCAGLLAAVRFAGNSRAPGGAEEATLLTPHPVPFRAVFAEPVKGHAGEEQPMIFDSVTRVSHRVGPPEDYDVVRLSPRGTIVAALGRDHLHLVEISTDVDRVVTLPSGTYAGGVTWSPDGAEAAIVGEHLVVVNAAGARLAQVDARAGSAPGAPRGSAGTATNCGECQWSPVGHRFAAIINDELIEIDSDGSARRAAVPTLVPGITPSTPVIVAGWRGSDTVVLGTRNALAAAASTSKLARGWAVDVSHGLSATAGDNLAFVSTVHASRSAAPAADLDRYAAHPQVVSARRTEDGGADFFEVLPGRRAEGGMAPILLVLLKGTTEAVRLPGVTDVDGELMDAVLAH